MNKKRKCDDYPSLYDAFHLGDRVKRVHKDKKGKSQEYKGIVLAIDKKSIEVYWDTMNGKFRPSGMDVTFTNCPVIEIFNGNNYYTPIKLEK
jgi:hypothetical protein